MRQKREEGHPSKGVSGELGDFSIGQVHEEPVGEDHIRTACWQLQLCGIPNLPAHIAPAHTVQALVLPRASINLLLSCLVDCHPLKAPQSFASTRIVLAQQQWTLAFYFRRALFKAGKIRGVQVYQHKLHTWKLLA